MVEIWLEAKNKGIHWYFRGHIVSKEQHKYEHLFRIPKAQDPSDIKGRGVLGEEKDMVIIHTYWLPLSCQVIIELIM